MPDLKEMPDLKGIEESDLKKLTFKQLKSILIDKYTDFFDVMFFGKFKYDEDLKHIEDQKAILGNGLKEKLARNFTTNEKRKKILTSPNQEIEGTILSDSQQEKEDTRGNIHTLPDYENKKKLYEIIAYTYDKEVAKTSPINEWSEKMVFTDAAQSSRLDGRVNQIETIKALDKSTEGKNTDFLLFNISRKEGGFQKVNYTVKPLINEEYDKKTFPKIKEQLDELSNGDVQVLATEMYNRKKGDKEYEDITEFKTEKDKDNKIYFVDATAQKLREYISREKSILKNEILVADAGNAYSPGGDPLGGGGGQEESLIKSDPDLYLNLLKATSDFYGDNIEYEQEKYEKLAKNAIAMIDIYNEAKKHTGSDKLLLAIKGEIKEPLTKDDEISSFMSGLLSSTSFKNKSLLLKEIEKEAEDIKSGDKIKKVKKLAEDMFKRKSKHKIVMINPNEDDLEEPVLKTPKVEASDSAGEPPKLKNGYVVFNAPDLRASKQYMSSKLCKKLKALVETEKEKLVGKSEEEIDRIVEELIEKETPKIQEEIQNKINKRVVNSIKYQVAAACKAAEGKYKCLILGAIGGGIFKCPNTSVAKAFYEVLVNKKYKEAFDEVYFAIYKNPQAMKEYETVFKNVLGEKITIPELEEKK